MKPYTVARTLSIMTSSGMYDYAGEWVYRVGMPAKSGAAAALLRRCRPSSGSAPSRRRSTTRQQRARIESLRVAVDPFRPAHAQSLRRCAHLDHRRLQHRRHASRRSRQPRDQQILEEHHDDVRVIELVGALTFATIDYVSRKLAEKPTPLLIVDFSPRRLDHQRRRACCWRISCTA